MPASARKSIPRRFKGLPAGVIIPPIMLAMGRPIMNALPLRACSSLSSYTRRKLITTEISTAVVATLDMMDDIRAAHSISASRILLVRAPNSRIRTTSSRLERGTLAMASERPKETNTKNRI